jgi:hypothetical protein
MKIQTRLERHCCIKESKKKAQERVECVTMISRFVKLKTYKAYLIAASKELAPFFGFKDIAVLIYDSEKEKFFT